MARRWSREGALRRLRGRNYRRRAGYAPHAVYRHRSRPWEYTPIHPFAGEADELARLNIPHDPRFRMRDGDAAVVLC